MSEASDDLTLRLNVKFRDGTAPTLQAELLRLPGRQRVKRLLELGSLGLMAERVISADGGTRSSPGLTTPKLDTVPLQAGAAPGEQPVEKLSEPPVPSQELGSLGLMAERGMSAEGATRSSPGLTAPKHDAVALQGGAAPGEQPVEKLSEPLVPSQELGSLGLMAERGMSAEGATRSFPGLTAPKHDAVALQAAAPPGGQTIEKLSEPTGPSQEVGKIPIAGVVAGVEANQSPDPQQRAEETPGLPSRPRRRPGFNVDLTG
ncbi:hypothetical protein ABIC11_004518 [Pseudomonas oryzihabitans]